MNYIPIISGWTPFHSLGRHLANPKRLAERVMRQGGLPTRTFEDISKELFTHANLNDRDRYPYTGTGDIDKEDLDRDLVNLYLYGDDRGFKKVLPEDNIGHDYSQEILSSGRDPRTINTYYGKFPYHNLVLPPYARDQVMKLSKLKTNNSITLLDLDADAGEFDYADDVGRHLAHITNKNGVPSVTYSDMWDFMPKQYSLWHNTRSATSYMLSYALDKLGTPFILKKTEPIEFSEDYDPYDYEYDELYREILHRAGIGPEIIVRPKRDK